MMQVTVNGIPIPSPQDGIKIEIQTTPDDQLIKGVEVHHTGDLVLFNGNFGVLFQSHGGTLYVGQPPFGYQITTDLGPQPDVIVATDQTILPSSSGMTPNNQESP